MIINAQQITQALEKSFKHLYLVSGDELYLKLKTCEAIRAKAKEFGFMEYQLFTVDTKFSVNEFQEILDNASLFGEKSFIELRLINKPSDSLRQLLYAYIQNPTSDKILTVVSAKLDATDQKAKWYKSLTSRGVVVQVWPIKYQELPNWITARLNQAGFKISAEAMQLFIDKTENNLLAIEQVIERLKLSDIRGQVSVDNLLNCLIDNAHYDIFQLADGVLEGDLRRVKKLFFSLKEQGAESILILWAIVRDLRVLAEAAANTHDSIDNILVEHKVFRSRYVLIKKTLGRHSQLFWHHCLLKAQQLDGMIKGVRAGDIWQELFELCLRITVCK